MQLTKRLAKSIWYPTTLDEQFEINVPMQLGRFRGCPTSKNSFRYDSDGRSGKNFFYQTAKYMKLFTYYQTECRTIKKPVSDILASFQRISLKTAEYDTLNFFLHVTNIVTKFTKLKSFECKQRVRKKKVLDTSVYPIIHRTEGFYFLITYGVCKKRKYCF